MILSQGGLCVGRNDLCTSLGSKLSQQVSEVLLPIEWREIVNRFARADKARGNAKFILDRYYDPAFAAAVEFGDDQASESKRIVKLACLSERVAASRCIDYQQRFVRRIGVEFAEGAFYLVQLGHQICFRVLPSGCVAKQKI